jgi:hypothetical protein
VTSWLWQFIGWRHCSGPSAEEASDADSFLEKVKFSSDFISYLGPIGKFWSKATERHERTLVLFNLFFSQQIRDVLMVKASELDQL